VETGSGREERKGKEAPSDTRTGGEHPKESRVLLTLLKGESRVLYMDRWTLNARLERIKKKKQGTCNFGERWANAS